MLSDSVSKRRGQLSQDGVNVTDDLQNDLSYDSEESKEQQPVKQKGETVTLNLESVILIENKLYRIA